MTISLTRHDRAPFIDLLRKLLIGFLIPHIDRQYREGIINHLAWMERQKDQMFCKCSFETIPELSITKIKIEIGFDAKVVGTD
jgi:hypothetical protein